MASNNYRENDWIDRSLGGEQIFSTVTPRVLMVEPNGYVPMRYHRGWYELPGGHFTKEEGELVWDANLLNPDVIAPIIIRETKEETSVDIEPYVRSQSAILGLAEVGIIDDTRHTFTHAITPVMICKIPGALPFNRNIVKIPPGHIPIRTYPDAAMALIHLEKMRRKGARGPITPEWLNVWGEVIFLRSPHRRYIKGAPPLEELGLAHRPPRIPKNYPPEIKGWLSRQYRKM